MVYKDMEFFIVTMGKK